MTDKARPALPRLWIHPAVPCLRLAEHTNSQENAALIQGHGRLSLEVPASCLPLEVPAPCIAGSSAKALQSQVRMSIWHGGLCNLPDDGAVASSTKCEALCMGQQRMRLPEKRHTVSLRVCFYEQDGGGSTAAGAYSVTGYCEPFAHFELQWAKAKCVVCQGWLLLLHSEQPPWPSSGLAILPTREGQCSSPNLSTEAIDAAWLQAPPARPYRGRDQVTLLIRSSIRQA